MKDQTRNLNPTAPAVAAMYIWGDEYSQTGGGSMDFWDSLPKYKQRLCNELCEEIIDRFANKLAPKTVPLAMLEQVAWFDPTSQLTKADFITIAARYGFTVE